MKKITMQKIANELGVSRVSVWKVLNHKDGVSDSLKHAIIDKASELNYFNINSTSDIQSYKYPQPMTLSVLDVQHDDSIFWLNITHALGKQLAERNITMLHTCLSNNADTKVSLLSSIDTCNIHGMIIINLFNKTLLSELANMPIPKLYISSPRYEQKECFDLSSNKLDGDIIHISSDLKNSYSLDHIVSRILYQIFYRIKENRATPYEDISFNI